MKSKLKIAIISMSDSAGGAAKAAYRLHKALLSNQINSKMYVLKKNYTHDNTIITTTGIINKTLNLIRPSIEKLMTKKNTSGLYFSSSYFSNNSLVKKVIKDNPDIIHLHWINNGTLSIADFKKFKKPIVWSMHDNWPFTGGCHIKLKCTKYESMCTSCPLLHENLLSNLSKKIFIRKKKVYKKCDIYPVALSSWLEEETKKSSLMGKMMISKIPNPINTNLYREIDSAAAKNFLNIKPDIKVLLFGAVNPLKDFNKGGDLLLQAFKYLTSKNIVLLIAGTTKPEKELFPIESIYLGSLSDELSLILAYNAADVTIVPSRQENLSNTIMESLACGTPVAAFNTGGNKDMVITDSTGYLAENEDSEDLAKGIEKLLSQGKSYYSSKCIEFVKTHFSESIVADKMINLYNSILNK
jgi:glycosyltransferase involved in cell wall biosynthesis